MAARPRNGHQEASEVVDRSQPLSCCRTGQRDQKLPRATSASPAKPEAPDSPLCVRLFKIVQDLLPEAEIGGAGRM
jgi:hypothetical protein